MSEARGRSHRTLFLIILSWAVTAGLTVAEGWGATPWVTVSVAGLLLWIGGKAAAVALSGRVPKP